MQVQSPWVLERRWSISLPGWRWFFAGLVVLVYVGVGLSVAWPAVAPTRMAVFAHRGDVDHWPENTLESVVAASRTAADGVEFDVRRSADGTWWLLHDASLDRTTKATGKFNTYHDVDIERLLVERGPGFHGQPGVHLARLSTLLAALRGYGGTLILDVKEPDPESHAEIARLAPPGSYIICRTIEGASAVKAVSRSLTTITLRTEVLHPDVDVWLAEAGNGISWPRATLIDAAGTLAMFVNIDTEERRTDEVALLENGRRWGAAFVITNHVEAALAWRDGGESPSIAGN